MEPTDILMHRRVEALLHTLTAEDEAGNKEHTSRGGRTLHTHKCSPGFKSNMDNRAGVKKTTRVKQLLKIMC